MSIILNKSNFNLDAAQFLINESLFAPSVHCSYYGCLQYIKYSIKNYENVTYAELDKKCATGYGSHNTLKNYLFDIIRQKVNNSELRSLKRKFEELKEFREKSDYQEIEIKLNDSEKSLQFSQEIISEIKKYLR